MDAIASQKKQKWLKYARKVGATHLIIVHEWFEDTTYPEYVIEGEDLFDRIEKISSRVVTSDCKIIDIKRRDASSLRLVVNNGRLIEHVEKLNGNKEMPGF